MPDEELLAEVLRQILEAARRIERRFEGIREPSDFLKSDEGLDRLDGIAMMLIAIGERLKKLDKLTQGELLRRYPEIDWKAAKGARDVLSHHYFKIDVEIVFGICQKRIQPLISTVEQIQREKGAID